MPAGRAVKGATTIIHQMEEEMSPELDEFKCSVCEQVTERLELDRHEGMCYECHSVMSEAEVKLDATAPGDTEEADPEVLKAVERAMKRKEYMREYNSRPDIAAKRREYMRGRAERERLLLQKAREKGLMQSPHTRRS